jgi:hypothetical protein
MNISYIVNPIVTSGVVSVVGSVALVWLVAVNRAAIIGAMAMIRQKLFTRSGFFWTVNLIFMAVSVLHAGAFFGITGNGHDIPGVAQYLGFAVSFFLDLVTIILMQALLEAKYRSDEQRARQFLLFITICCATSTFANLAISLNDFDATVLLPNAPLWIQIAAPYVLASFPLFVILMSIAAEMIVNVRPLDSLNEDEYESDEKKRVKLMQIRNDYLQRQADEELRALTIRSQMQMNKRMRSGRMPQSFRWFWEKAIDIDAVIAGVSMQLKAAYEPQIEALKQQLEEVKNQQPILQSEEQIETFLDDNLEPSIAEEIVQSEPAQPVQNTAVPTMQNSAPAVRKNASPKVQKDGATRAMDALKKDANLTAKQLAKKAGISESYAQKIKADFAKETAPKPEPKAQDTDPLPVTNGHRKDTQPLANLVEMRV